MIASTRNTGKDEPFAFDLTAETFITVNGITNANTPTTPAATGAWVPPQIAQVGRRVLVTHPGFPGGGQSDAFFATFVGDITIGSATVKGWFPNMIAAPAGAAIFGTGIPAAATTGPATMVSLSGKVDSTSGSNVLVLNGANPGIFRGMQLSFDSQVVYITDISGLPNIVVSDSAILTGNGWTTEFVGHTLTLSANATTNTQDDPLTVSKTGSSGVRFGWFDISSFSATIVARGFSGASVIGIADPTGLQPGMTVSGANIPAGAVIKDIVNPTLVGVSGTTYSSTLTGTAVVSISLPRTPGLDTNIPVVGQTAFGPGLVPGTIVTDTPVLTGGVSDFAFYDVPISILPLGNFTGLYTFSGQYSVMIDKVLTGFVGSITVAGGTPTAPLWGAGDTALNPLPSNPLGVTQRNGRAWFACGKDGIPFSDSLVACVRTNASQALETGDGLAVTALGPLGQISQLTSSVVQATVVFEGASKIQLITGDQATNDLAMNELPIETGTLAPGTLAPSTQGLAFMSPQGLRVMGFTSNVSDVIGGNGEGISVPFINAVEPTRMSMAAHDSAIRVAVQNGDDLGHPYQEWWYHLKKGVWSGPHTLDTALISPWDDPVTGISTFVTTSRGHPARLYRSDTYQTDSATFVEDDGQLRWSWQTTLLPINGLGNANSIVQSTMGMLLPPDSQILVVGLNEAEATLAWAKFPTDLTQVQWNYYRQFQIPWQRTLVFNQLIVNVTALSSLNLEVGTLVLNIRPLGYQYAPPPILKTELGVPVLGPDGLPIAA